MWQAIIALLVGFWAIFSGFYETLIVPSNFIISGIVLAVFGFFNFRTWQGYINGFAGVWFFISGFIPQLQTPQNLFIVGIIVAAVSAWELLTIGSARQQPTPQH